MIRKGEIRYADLGAPIGSEQGGRRPVVIIQNNVGNEHSPTTIVAIITTKTTKAKLPTHHWLQDGCGLPRKSMVELEQIKTIDKSRLGSYIGEVSETDLAEINRKLKISLGLR